MRAPGEKLLADKKTHEEVDYQHVTPFRERTCGNCSMFINEQPYRCTDVRSPIYRGGWCMIWEGKKK